VIGYVLLAMIDRATADRKQPVPGLPRGESAYFAMTGLFILFSVFFVILYSLSDFDIQKCKEALALNTPANVDKKAKTENEKQDEKTIVVSWAFEKSENSDGIPEAKVYLKFEHFKYEGSDRVFVSKENAWPMKYEANADTGLSSSFWHAGAGSEFHAKKEGSNLVVYRQYVEEISPEAQEKGVVPPEREKLRSIPIPSDRRIRYETKEQ
jgi:hypothetical protein